MRGSIISIVLLMLAWNACGDGLKMSSTSKTNAETGIIKQADIYTRNGVTNLIRRSMILKDGTIQARIHRIYKNDRHIADISEVLDSFSIQTEPNTPYYLDFDFRPDKTVRCVGLISTNGETTDLYLGTNNVIVPVSTPDLRKAQGMGADTIELMRDATNMTPSQFNREVKELMKEHRE